ncbi:MAG: DUF1513 domain-containing protein [Pseudomonadota bacterium]
MLTRRHFLLGTGAALGVACSGRGHAPELFLSAAADSKGQHYVAGFDPSGSLVFRTPIGFRGHDVIAAPDRDTGIVVARRPRTQLLRFDLGDGRVLDEVASAPGRHFYGHGLYTPDGRHFLTTENDFEFRRGVIVVRDATTLKVQDEFDSHGVGPHEMRWLSDGRTLAIANGGILTHPSRGREKLNLATMQPNLAFVDSVSGQLLRMEKPEHHTTSVRHIDMLADDQVVVAMQQEDYAAGDLPLVARSGGGLSNFAAPENELRRMKQYTASVCVDRASGNALATCPRGDRVNFWNTVTGQLVGAQRLLNAGGVCVDETRGEFVVTTGHGTIHRFDTTTFEYRRDKTVRVQGLSWDNHVTAV